MNSKRQAWTGGWACLQNPTTMYIDTSWPYVVALYSGELSGDSTLKNKDTQSKWMSTAKEHSQRCHWSLTQKNSELWSRILNLWWWWKSCPFQWLLKQVMQSSQGSLVWQIECVMLRARYSKATSGQHPGRRTCSSHLIFYMNVWCQHVWKIFGVSERSMNQNLAVNKLWGTSVPSTLEVRNPNHMNHGWAGWLWNTTLSLHTQTLVCTLEAAHSLDHDKSSRAKWSL